MLAVARRASPYLAIHIGLWTFVAWAVAQTPLIANRLGYSVTRDGAIVMLAALLGLMLPQGLRLKDNLLDMDRAEEYKRLMIFAQFLHEHTELYWKRIINREVRKRSITVTANHVAALDRLYENRLPHIVTQTVESGRATYERAVKLLKARHRTVKTDLLFLHLGVEGLNDAIREVESGLVDPYADADWPADLPCRREGSSDRRGFPKLHKPERRVKVPGGRRWIDDDEYRPYWHRPIVSI